MGLILHIPHSSKKIPQKYLPSFLVPKKRLEEELLKMTDHFTDDLFNFNHPAITRIRFPVSRLLVDPERFENDKDEPMSKIGMGCIYEMTYDKKPLKEIHCKRDELIKTFYLPHHEEFTSIVEKSLKSNNQVLIIDCHSFPKFPLPYEFNQEMDRAEICIGTDDFHTPPSLRDKFINQFENLGFSVAVNEPFAGAIVPLKFYKIDQRVRTLMIEVRRDLYMNEKTGEKLRGFVKLRDSLEKMILEVYEKHD
tara:strand:+ start:192 stop:944 length:753 start_codon:yes stop_codon:yes gene_type:complete